MSAEYSVDWPSPSERNPHRTMRGEFCSLLSDLQREWMKDGAADGSAAIDAAYEALHQFVSRLATQPHSPDAADSGRVNAFAPIPEAKDAPTDEFWNAYNVFNDHYCGFNTQQALRYAINNVLGHRASLAAQGRGEACPYCDGTGDVHSIDGEWRGECTECSAAMESSFKNFHRQLCERFGYTHDEKDWRRDQVSLIEHIAAKVSRPTPPASPAGVPDGDA